MEAHSRAGILLVRPVARLDEAVRALSEGADVVDVAAARPKAAAAISGKFGDAVIWGGDPAAVVDADRVAHAAGLAPSPVCAAAAAAITVWTGSGAAVRTAHTTAARRAIDMAETIRGDRPPALAVRGLA